MQNKSNLKETAKYIWWGIIVLALLAILAFSTQIIYCTYKDNIKEAVSMTFSLFGMLITAGAAFATVAALLSYISVNDKLKQADQDLKKTDRNLKKAKQELKKAEDAINDISIKKTELDNLSNNAEDKYKKLEESLASSEQALEKFKELNEEREKLENSVRELEGYKISVKELAEKSDIPNSSEEIETIKQNIQNILLNSDAPFQDRLLAYAISNNIQAQEFKDKEQWEDAYSKYKDNEEYWKMLYLYDPEKNTKHYISTLFNVAYSLSQISKTYKEYKTVSEYYDKLIFIMDKSEIEINSLATVYNNLGSSLDEQAQVISQSNPDKAQGLWKQAEIKYKKAIEINPNDDFPYNNLGNLLNNQAKMTVKSDLEKAKELWRQARENYQTAIEINPNNDLSYGNWLISIYNEMLLTKNIELFKQLKDTPIFKEFTNQYPKFYKEFDKELVEIFALEKNLEFTTVEDFENSKDFKDWLSEFRLFRPQN